MSKNLCWVYTINDVCNVTNEFKLNTHKLLLYLRNNIDIFPLNGELKIKKFKFGQSNPTYLLIINDIKFVLRKKPSGKILPSAHAIEREYYIMNALRNSMIPVPKTYCLCLDNNIIGTPFYVCEFIDGRVFNKGNQLNGLKQKEKFAIYSQLNKVLARIHSLNLKEYNLLDFGGSHAYKKKYGNKVSNINPKNYIERLKKRWYKQFMAAKSDKTDPAILKFFDTINNYKMRDNCEIETLIHGDFRLDNCIFDRKSFRILAVIDWELSTIGHPLTDMGTLSLMYHAPKEMSMFHVGVQTKLNQKRQWGIPNEFQFLQAYIRNLDNNSDLIKNFEFPIKDWVCMCLCILLL